MSRSGPGAPVVVNGSFWPQPVTGQQRYAREIGSRLEAGGLSLLRPPPAWSGSAARTWAWSQGPLPARTRGSVLVSLTSRAPVAHRRHVVTVHDLFPVTHPEWYSRRYAAFHAPLLRRLLRTAAAVVTVSAPVRDQVRALGLAPERTPVVVAPNAAGAAFAGDAPTSATELPFVPAGADGFLLAVGTLEPRKNLPRLVRAHQRLDDDVRRRHPLVLVGASASIYAELDLPRDDRVVLAGFVTDAQLAAAYRRATAVVAPSLDEGFGLPLVEAVRSGAVLLASDIPVFRWVAGDAATYVDPLDEADIARGLLAAVEGRVRPGPLPRTYDWETSAATVLDVAGSLA
ncbi:glycosyltransferase family 1 protein [Nocardioides sp. SOB77]|uniref:Glycosyltransferase family 1 protein n=1 Tax=Nocardioides oceani TaxID=3058369 RepID=A0ABT8FGP5_9ACTN|nr:glycosyltransferase family 1 protein [Nocardioides oceani]MDN4173610.1 glycosyltransferase family 1 protein [Nocardioides oceani]